MCVLDPGPYLEVAVEPGADDDPELPCTRPVRGSGSHASQLRLGAKVTLVAPLGGETGQVLGHLIAREGLRTSTVGTGDANGSVIDDRRAPGAEPIDVPGALLSRHDRDDLHGRHRSPDDRPASAC